MWEKADDANELNRTGKIIYKFSDFYFSSFRETFIENWGDDVTKMTITRKNKNWKFDFSWWWNLDERPAIGWIERKIKFQILLIFIFRVIVEKHWSRKLLNAVEREPVPNKVLNPKAYGVQRYSPGRGWQSPPQFFFSSK